MEKWSKKRHEFEEDSLPSKPRRWNKTATTTHHCVAWSYCRRWKTHHQSRRWREEEPPNTTVVNDATTTTIVHRRDEEPIANQGL